MPITPQDRLRAALIARLLPEMAEMLLKIDKPNPSMKLSDLRDDDERTIFVADILELLSPERRAERTMRLNIARGQTNACTDAERENVLRQAREDVKKYGNGTGSVN